MTLGRMLAALSACLLLAACGGSSPHASSTASSPTGTAAAGAGAGAGAVAPAAGTSTSTSTSRARARARARSHSGSHTHRRTATHSRTAAAPQASTRASSGAGNGSGGATLPAFFLIQPGGSLSPPTIPAPARALIALGVANHDHRAHTVVLVADGRHTTLHVAAGAGTNTVLKPLPVGSYRILIDGRPRGRLLVGTQGGP